MANTKIRKKKSQIDLLSEEYDKLTIESKKKLQIIQDTVSGGSAPEEKQVQDFKESITGLRDTYNKICAIARERLSESELPPEGSAAKDFVTAVKESKAAELDVYRKKALEVLQRFGKIWSDDRYYLELLSDHKKASYENVSILKDPELAGERFTETEDYVQIMIPAETFLKALDCEDPDSDEGIELLDKVCQYFSFKAAVGIMKKQYYIMKYGW